ncbi:MAG: MBL fold metallo-hydrolase [Halalkalicoccus sp.]
MSEIGLPDPGVEVESIPPEEIEKTVETGRVTVLDVRVEQDFEEWRIDVEASQTINVPYYELLDGIDGDLIERLSASDRVVVVCPRGNSSRYITALLSAEGIEARNLSDGMNGWANLYEHETLDIDTETTVLQYQRPSSGCLAYLVVSDGEAGVIDPLAAFVDRYVRDADAMDAEIRYAIDTHIHADHVSGVRGLAAETGAEIVLSEPVVSRGVDFEVDRAVTNGERLPLGESTIEVVHTPGHTTGMTAYRVEGVLFSGDTLFTESVARPDLQGGAEDVDTAAETLWNTLNDRIRALPDETVIAPAHFGERALPGADGTYTAPIGELETSVALLDASREAFVEAILEDMPPRPANYEEIIKLNRGRREASDEEAFSLELGPNNCSAG